MRLLGVMESSSGYRNKDPSRLARLVARQHGVVAVWQLGECGYSRFAVARRVEAAVFHRIHRGVFAVGHPRITLKGHYMAAVLAGGPEAVLSHHAAAALWDLRPSPQSRIDITTPGKRDHKGIRCHISPLPARYRTTIDAIPVTTLYRTYIDYAESANERQIRAALEEGQRRGILDFRRLHQAIDDHPGRRGLKPLRASMQDLADDPPWLASDLEREFAELLRASGLPAPSHNVIVEGELVDCAWPAQRVIVELDGYGFHRGRHAFEADRRRDIKLQAAGWRVIRITYRRIRDDGPAVMEEIRRLLAG